MQKFYKTKRTFLSFIFAGYANKVYPNRPIALQHLASGPAVSPVTSVMCIIHPDTRWRCQENGRCPGRLEDKSLFAETGVSGEKRYIVFLEWCGGELPCDWRKTDYTPFFLRRYCPFHHMKRMARYDELWEHDWTVRIETARPVYEMPNWMFKVQDKRDSDCRQREIELERMEACSQESDQDMYERLEVWQETAMRNAEHYFLRNGIISGSRIRIRDKSL